MGASCGHTRMKCNRCMTLLNCKSHRGWRLRHGMYKTTEWRAYNAANGRCNNPNNPKYKNYGGRGIKFLFGSFEQWYDEIGQKPSPQHSHDHIDNNSNYEPGNVRWATKTVQRLNFRPKSIPNRRNSMTGRFESRP